MRPSACVVPLLVAATAAAEPAAAQGRAAYSLGDVWDNTWIRLADRHGRADPDGPLLQRFHPRQNADYDVDLAVPEFRLRDELAWVEQRSGARFWVQSFDELTLANRFQVKTQASMGGGAALGLRYDRTETLETQSSLLRVEFLFEDFPAKGTFVALSTYPRWEKEDSDLELRAGFRDERWGRAQLRIFAFDPFMNASQALLRRRDRSVDVHIKQLDPPLAVAVDLASVERAGIRSELYAGRLFPARTRFTHPERPADDHLRAPAAWLAGFLLEGRPADLPITVGISALLVDTVSPRELEDPGRSPSSGQLSPSLGASSPSRVEERTLMRQAYLLWDPHPNLVIDASLRWLSRPESKDGSGSQDEAVLLQLLATWMPLEVFGVDLGFVRNNRETVNKPELGVDGLNHRILTRLVLALGKTWWRFGTGWNLDVNGRGIYDGSGLTMTADF